MLARIKAHYLIDLIVSEICTNKSHVDLYSGVDSQKHETSFSLGQVRMQKQSLSLASMLSFDSSQWELYYCPVKCLQVPLRKQILIR